MLKYGIILCLTVFYSCALDFWSNGKSKEKEEDRNYCEEKEWWQGTANDIFFQAGGVYIFLRKEASFDFEKIYTPEDFQKDLPGITIYNVTDMTELTIKQVQKQLGGNQDELKRYSDSGMLIDVEKFRRILFLDLYSRAEGWPSKEKVFNAIKLIEKREDIIYVETIGNSLGDSTISKRAIGLVCVGDPLFNTIYSNDPNRYPRPRSSISGSFKSFSKETERRVKEAMAMPNKDSGYIDGMPIYMYLGAYDNDSSFVILTHGPTVEGGLLPPITVGGIVFYSQGNGDNIFPRGIKVWKDDQLYSLQEAYNEGFLEQEDLRNIAYFWHSGRELNDAGEK